MPCPRCGVKRYGSGVGDVERGETASRRNACQYVAALARKASQPLPLGTEHERNGPFETGRIDRHLTVAVEADAAHTKFAELFERPREVADECDRYHFEAAGRRLRERARKWWAVAARHDEPAGAEHGGRAQDRADIVRVRDLIEHDQRTGSGA